MRSDREMLRASAPLAIPWAVKPMSFRMPPASRRKSRGMATTTNLIPAPDDKYRYSAAVIPPLCRGKTPVQRQRTFVVSRLTLRSWIAACITELAVDILD